MYLSLLMVYLNMYLLGAGELLSVCLFVIVTFVSCLSVYCNISLNSVLVISSLLYNSASTTAPSQSYSSGDVTDHRSMLGTAAGNAVEVYSVLLIDSVNFEGD